MHHEFAKLQHTTTHLDAIQCLLSQAKALHSHIFGILATHCNALHHAAPYLYVIDYLLGEVKALLSHIFGSFELPILFGSHVILGLDRLQLRFRIRLHFLHVWVCVCVSARGTSFPAYLCVCVFVCVCVLVGGYSIAELLCDCGHVCVFARFLTFPADVCSIT